MALQGLLLERLPRSLPLPMEVTALTRTSGEDSSWSWDGPGAQDSVRNGESPSKSHCAAQTCSVTTAQFLGLPPTA